jgi:hypothetical protein
MKKLLLLLLLSVPVFGQNLRYDSIAIGPRGPIPFASVGVCSQPANVNSAPCSPLIALCTSFTSSCTLPGTTTADNLGNFHFYAPSSAFPVTVQIYGAQVAAPFALRDQNAPGGFFSKSTTEVCIGTCAMVITGQIQLFQITLTGNTVANSFTSTVGAPATLYFEISQDSGGSHTWTWPANSIGGCSPINLAAFSTTTQAFVWDGTNAVAIGPCVIGAGPSLLTGPIGAQGNIQTTTQFISTIASGTAPLVVASTTQVANLNSSLLLGGTWATPGTIGSTTPSTGAFSTFQLNGGTIQTAMQGTDTHLLSAGTVSGTGSALCTDAQGGATTVSCTTPVGIGTPQAISLAAPVSLTANVQAIVLSKSVTFPSAAGNYHADLRSGLWLTAGPNACATEIEDVTNTKAYASGNAQNANGSGFIGIAGAEITSQTYTAGQVVTFRLIALCNANSTAVVDWSLVSGTLSPQEESFLQITPIAGN